MVTIENKKITIGIDGFNEKNEKTTFPLELSYGKLILDCSDRGSNSQTGFTTEDIRKISKVEKVIKTHENENKIKMEDADFEFVKEKVRTMTWKYRKMELVDFVDYIKSLKPDA